LVLITPDQVQVLVVQRKAENLVYTLKVIEYIKNKFEKAEHKVYTIKIKDYIKGTG
jgi:hypothetical protein